VRGLSRWARGMGARVAQASQWAVRRRRSETCGRACSHLESGESGVAGNHQPFLSSVCHLSRAEVNVAAASRRCVEGVATPRIPQLAGDVAMARGDVARLGCLGPAGPVADPAIPRR
jgi:hypothetical protein